MSLYCPDDNAPCATAHCNGSREYGYPTCVRCTDSRGTRRRPIGEALAAARQGTAKGLVTLGSTGGPSEARRAR